MKPNRELDDSKKYADFSDNNTDLRIIVDESGADVEKKVQSTLESLSVDGYEDTQTEKVTFGANEFVCVSGINSKEKRRAEVYLINVGKQIWSFDFDLNTDDYEYNKDIIEKFLESLDLSGVK